MGSKAILAVISHESVLYIAPINWGQLRRMLPLLLFTVFDDFTGYI